MATVLILHHRRDVAEQLADGLMPAGWDAIVACSLLEAKAAVQQVWIDIVFVDDVLVESTAALESDFRDDTRLHRTPFVHARTLSSVSDPSELVIALEAALRGVH